MKYYVLEQYFISSLKRFWRKKFENEKNIRRDINRFFSKIKIEKNERVKGLGPCWIFKSSDNGRGYGRILFDNKIRLSHKVSFRLFRGKVSEGLLVCHKCDVRKCCKPEHLFLGTYKENTQDMLKKGRQIDPKVLSERMKGKVNLGKSNGSHTRPDKRPKGSKIGTSKVNEEIVLRIRKLYSTGKYTQKQLGRKFNLFRGNVQKIITRQIWKHI